ncbi:MAG: NnrS family protein [bacterium]
MVTLAAVVRVFVPLLNPHWISDAVLVSALLWSSGFALYTWRYWPVLSREF